ncbi:MAG: hypothetical protein JEZ01_20505 [Labilibaculum sp.]|nr:hypothetical protein [Labilibaculum sp.]MBI9060161.1 hypothetical protein [Labilibaculum sp.]
MDTKVIDNIREMEKALRVPVKIPHDEVDRIVVVRLIGIRNSEVNKRTDTSFIDKTIKWFLDDDEFQKYVIEQKEIEY